MSVRDWFVRLGVQVLQAYQESKRKARAEARAARAAKAAQAAQAKAEHDKEVRQAWANTGLVERVARGLPVPLALSIEESARHDGRLRRLEEMQHAADMGALGDCVTAGELSEYERQEPLRKALAVRLLLHGYLPEVVANEVGWRVEEVKKLKEERNL